MGDVKTPDEPCLYWHDGWTVGHPSLIGEDVQDEWTAPAQTFAPGGLVRRPQMVAEFPDLADCVSYLSRLHDPNVDRLLHELAREQAHRRALLERARWLHDQTAELRYPWLRSTEVRPEWRGHRLGYWLCAAGFYAALMVACFALGAWLS